MTQPVGTVLEFTREDEQYLRVVKWSPDGSRLALISTVRPSITIVDLDTDGGEVELRGNFKDSISVAWSPDGQRLITGHNDGEVRLWDLGRPEPSVRLDGLRGDVHAVAWHPGGHLVAATGWNGDIIVWDTKDGTVQRLATANAAIGIAWSPDGGRLGVSGSGPALAMWNRLTDTAAWESKPGGFLFDLAWSPDGRWIGAAGDQSALQIVDAATGDLQRTLEGHSTYVVGVSISSDGRAIAALDEAGRLRIWDTSDWMSSASYDLGREPNVLSHPLDFHPNQPRLAVGTGGGLEIWRLAWNEVFTSPGADETVQVTTAKVVLVGDSNAGKSCLAMRLAEDRYPRDEELGTTHGMRFWPVEASELHPSAAAPAGSRRDVVLWDFGGQHEYRLVHQLFFNHTTVALVLFDPTRGEGEFAAVRDWNLRLEKQLGGRVTKLLIGAKQDQDRLLANQREIDKLVAGCDFEAYVDVSALNGRNIPELREVLAKALDWEALGTTSRPELFQLVRDHIEELRQAGRVVLRLDELSPAIEARYPSLFDAADVAAAATQLSVQGVIAQTTLDGGVDALVLQIPVIERYAASLIVAARNNPRGVPALEERLLGSPELPLPGIADHERLPRTDEQVVLECVAELMIKHGLCFRHARLLIFPSLFPATAESDAALGHSVTLFYDFTGPIDNVYASLVAGLMLSGEFGHGRLYARRAEFDQPEEGVCGVRHAVRGSGVAHLDLFFSEHTDPGRRSLFARFVADHLTSQGIVIRERQAITCRGCQREISEAIVEENVRTGHVDVVCAYCRTTTLISDGVTDPGSRDNASRRRVLALRAEVDAKTRQDSERAKAAVSRGDSATAEAIRLLHLSDLHFTAETSPQAKAQWLLQDLRDNLGGSRIEYLVISGDITDRGSPEGFERGREFVELLNEELGVSAERCVFVPGNHDVQDTPEAYDVHLTAAAASRAEPDEARWHREGALFLTRNPDQYPRRLQAFSDAFFHKVVQQPYPRDVVEQGQAYLFADTGIQFLALNSCWEIDHFHRKRASISADAIATALKVARTQCERTLQEGQPLLRIAVWHHALQHPQMMANVDFAGLLQSAGVRLVLHGDVHELSRERFRYWNEKTMHIAGAGSFGSSAAGRPESTPHMYNLLEIDRSLTSVRVHTRRQLKPDGPWEGWAEWPMPNTADARLPYYDLDF